MAQYFSADIDFDALQDAVLRELHEPVAVGSEAVPLDLVKDTLNMVYAETFNDQSIKKSAREADVTFQVADDTTLNGDLASGAVTIPATETSSFLTAGKLLLEGDIVTYTGNAADIFTGVTGVSVIHYSGETVRQLYPLATLASDLDSELIRTLQINGILQQYMTYENLINQIEFYPNSYTVYNGNLLFSRKATLGGTAQGRAFMTYAQKVTPMSADADKPTLIPNSMRIPLLVYGACMKIAASDSFRTSWDWWKEQHDIARAQYVARMNTRVADRNNKIRPTIYQRMI